MTAEVINGQELASNLREKMKQEVAALNNNKIFPKLTVILIGDDPASQAYVKGKHKACNEAGIISEIIRKDASISEAELLVEIDCLNNDEPVHGILVQLTILKHIDEQKVIEAHDPIKVVDELNSMNVIILMNEYTSVL